MNEKWSPVRALLFKFLLIYFFLFALPIQFLFQDQALWIAEHLLGIQDEIRTGSTGSGDMLIHWIHFCVDLSIALLGTVIWSVLDRNKNSYPRTAEFLYIIIRYFLAFTLTGYGLAKIIPSQFPLPSLVRLTQEFGNASPMGLAWTFLGFSTGYQIFSGVMEFLAGSLLLFRRTVLLGAILAAGVMTNVFFINIFFDVPVKLFSAHLLLISIGLISLHFKPLWDFFILQRKAKQKRFPFPLSDNDWIKISYVIKAVLIFGAIFIQTYGTYYAFTSPPKTPEIAGIYHVEEFIINDKPIEPLTTNKDRWQRVVIDNQRAGLIAIDYISNKRVQFNADISAESDSISGKIPSNPALEIEDEKEIAGTYHNQGNTLLLEGSYGSDSLFVRLKKEDYENILLMNRGFNWVNDFPYNR